MSGLDDGRLVYERADKYPGLDVNHKLMCSKAVTETSATHGGTPVRTRSAFVQSTGMAETWAIRGSIGAHTTRHSAPTPAIAALFVLKPGAAPASDLRVVRNLDRYARRANQSREPKSVPSRALSSVFGGNDQKTADGLTSTVAIGGQPPTSNTLRGAPQPRGGDP